MSNWADLDLDLELQVKCELDVAFNAVIEGGGGISDCCIVQYSGSANILSLNPEVVPYQEVST